MRLPRKRILLAVDGSDASLDTVRYAADIFQPAGTEIVLFHVAANIPGIFWHVGKQFQDRAAPARAWVYQTHRTMRTFLSDAAQELTRAGFPPGKVTAKIERQRNSVARDIMSEAIKRYDAVVVNCKGRSRTKDALLGKTGIHLIRHLRDMPIILVSGKPAARKVMIALDSSEDASRGIACVCKLLAQTPAEFTLCHVIKSRAIYYPPISLYYGEGKDEKWTAKNRKRIDPWIEKTRGYLTEAGVTPDRIHVSILENAVSRATSLLNEARKTGIGTIVTGRRHLSGLESWLLGSVSRQVVSWARGMAVWVTV